MSQAQKDRTQTELKRLHEQRMAELTYCEVNGLREVKPDAVNLMVTLALSSADDFNCSWNELDHFITRDMSNIPNVELQNMFAQEKLVILQGMSGSGKTNLCHALISQWQAGRLWENRYDFVFLINVHELTKSMVGGPFTIDRALQVLYPTVFGHIAVQDLRNFRYLIIVDSLDQCDVKKICLAGEPTIESAIKELLTMETSCDRLVIGTPRSCQPIRQHVLMDNHVRYLDVLGFSEHQVMEYVLKFCQTDINRPGFLWQQIKENRSMLGYARLPLFANVICNVLSANFVDTIETRTELFVWAYTLYQIRHLQKHRPFVDVSSHEKLFGYEILMDALISLGRMAYDNLINETTSFDPDEFFDATEIESALITPLLHRRQQFLGFAHELFIEFLAAIHLFVNRQQLNHEIVQNSPRLRGVLPIFCGLLGAASENPNSQQIVLDLVKLFVKKLNIDHITKHPLCGVSGALSETDKKLYMALCFEFQNSLLLNDAEMQWYGDVALVAKRHVELDHILFFLRYFRQAGRPIGELSIRPEDRTLSLNECIKLAESIVSFPMLNMLCLGDIKVNHEMMRILSPAICLVKHLVCDSIRTTDVECWEILRKVMQDRQKSNTLYLKTLRLSNCDLNNEIKNKLSPVICMISNVCFESFRNASVECWEGLRIVVQDLQKRSSLSLETLVFEKCDLNKEMMDILSPVICSMSSVWFKSIRTESKECWEILRNVMQARRRTSTLRLEMLGLNKCDLNKEITHKLSPVICLIPTVWLEWIPSTDVQSWKTLCKDMQGSGGPPMLRLKKIVARGFDVPTIFVDMLKGFHVMLERF